MENKIRTGTMLYPKTINLCDDNLTKANASSRNDFIEKAIHFYSGYLNSQNHINYINEIIDNTINSNIASLDDSISRLLFKLTVEINMIIQVIALHFDIDDEVLTTLRKRSIEQVQATIGKVNLKEVLKEYKEKEG